jgi:hypothetical protein
MSMSFSLRAKLDGAAADESSVNSAFFTGDRIDHEADYRGFAMVPPETMVEIEQADMQAAALDEIAMA